MTYPKTAFFTSKHELQTGNLTAGTWSRDFLTFAVCGKCWKTSILISLVTTRPPLHETVAFLSKLARGWTASGRLWRQTSADFREDFCSSKNNFRGHDISQGLDREPPSLSPHFLLAPSARCLFGTNCWIFSLLTLLCYWLRYSSKSSSTS